MNKINLEPLKNFLSWLGVIVAVFVFTLMVQLLISFVFLSRHLGWTFAGMIKWSSIFAFAAAILQPLCKHWVSGQTEEDEIKKDEE